MSFLLDPVRPRDRRRSEFDRDRVVLVVAPDATAWYALLLPLLVLPVWVRELRLLSRGLNLSGSIADLSSSLEDDSTTYPMDARREGTGKPSESVVLIIMTRVDLDFTRAGRLKPSFLGAKRLSVAFMSLIELRRVKRGRAGAEI